MRRTFPRFGARKAAVVYASTAPIMGAGAPIVKSEGDELAKSKAHKLFAERLKAAMAQRGMEGRGGASKLAKLIGARPQLVASWLRGERIPSGTYIAKLTRSLQISIDALVSQVPTGDEGGRGAPSDAEFFLWGAEAARRLLGAEGEGISASVKLKLLEVTERDAVAKFGPRAHELAGEIRREIQRRHGVPESGASPDA